MICRWSISYIRSVIGCAIPGTRVYIYMCPRVCTRVCTIRPVHRGCMHDDTAGHVLKWALPVSPVVLLWHTTSQTIERPQMGAACYSSVAPLWHTTPKKKRHRTFELLAVVAWARSGEHIANREGALRLKLSGPLMADFGIDTSRKPQNVRAARGCRMQDRWSMSSIGRSTASV